MDSDSTTHTDTAVEAETRAHALERELVTLAAQIAQMTCMFLEKLAQFDAAQGWARRGFTSASQWLGFHCAMSTTTAREHLRVARALTTLPRTTQEFRAGRLSYSKVRALTRIAAPDTEEDLLAIADSATAGQLDRFLSGLRRASDLGEVNDTHSRRQVTWWTAEDGTVRLTAQLEPEDGAAVIDALTAAQEYLNTTATADSDTVTGDSAGPDRSRADALVLVCADSTVGRSEATDPTRRSRRGEAVVHTTLEQLAQVLPAPDEAPEPSDGHPAAAPSVPATSPHLGLGPALHPETARRLTCDTGVVLELHQESGAFGVIPSGQPGRTIDVGRRTRTPNAALIRALWSRDDGCRFPACERRRFVHAHHVIHWAQGGPTTLENMVLLCGEHHRMLHEGRYTMTLRGSQVRIFDPNGIPVRPPPPPLTAVPDADRWLPRGQFTGEATGQEVSTAPVAWTGPLTPVENGPLNLEYAVSVVTGKWELRREIEAARPQVEAAGTAEDDGDAAA